MLSFEELSVIKSEALKRWYQTPEGLALREKKQQLQRGNTYALGYRDTPEQRARKGEGQRKRKHVPSQWANMHKVRKGCFVPQEERDRIRAMNTGNHYHLGHRNSPEVIARMSEVKKGKVASVETKSKMSETGKRLWQEDSHREKLVKASRLALCIHPNKPEALVLSMLNEAAPNEWAFVGDGQLIIGGKNPDFANINGEKKIVECFGDYWHGQKARCYEETEEGRIALFKKFGFQTLIIWERELKYPEKVLARIRDFVERRESHETQS